MGLQEYCETKRRIGKIEVKEIFITILKIYICNLFFRDVAQPGSVLAWGARGRWFESSHPDFIRNKTINLVCSVFY